MSRSLSLFTIFIFLILIGLGTWQLFRKAEKENLLNELAQIEKQVPQNVDELKPFDMFMPAFAVGHFIPGKTIFLQSKSHQGKNGLYVLDFFETNKGQVLLVQRGWSASKVFSNPKGNLKIEGVARYPSKPNYFQPENQPPTYFWIDIKELSRERGQPLLPYYLVLKDSLDPQILPTNPIPTPRNKHLEYASTWYFLAFLIGIMFLWTNKIFRKKDLS